MVTLSLTEKQHATLLAMIVEMVTGQPVNSSTDVRSVLTELIENTEAEDALNSADEDEAELVMAMSGLTIQDALKEIAYRKDLVKTLVEV